MRVFGYSICLALLCFPALSIAQTRAEKNAAKQAAEAAAAAKALTVEALSPKITLKDDSLDVYATISTQGAYREKSPLLLRLLEGNDNFLRIRIEKRTGIASFQVYQTVYYTGDARIFNTVSYETLDGPRIGVVVRIDARVSECNENLACDYTEDFGFTVSEQLLRSLSADYDAEKPKKWSFKFGSRSGRELTTGIYYSEIAAALKAVDEYRAKNPAPHKPVETVTPDKGLTA